MSHPDMEAKEHQGQNKKERKVFHGQKKSIGYSYLVLTSSATEIGGAYQETVTSRTPTQVAIHAQKYFIRLNSMNRDRRRSSIHDITSLNNGDVSSHQAPIIGRQVNTSPAWPAPAMEPSVKHRSQTLI